jgi:putative ribosome biogenesis GTPase RsgA
MKCARYVENILQKMKTIERKQISKVDANILVYDKLRPNLKPKLNDVQLS